MNPVLPLCCPPAAFAAFARATDSLDSIDSLVDAAIAVSMLRHPTIKPVQVHAELQSLADTVRSRVRGTQPQAVIAHLHQYLFEEVGFTGNTKAYYDLENSFLPTVLKTHRGLPITLSLIYVAVAQKLDLAAHGIAMPGHFLASIQMDGETTLIDPFDGGRMITADEALDRLRQLNGPEAEWSDELTQPCDHRQWVTRMLQNLLNAFSSNGQYAEVASVLELEMQLWPENGQLHRDLALVLARAGMPKPAVQWLDFYLKSNPDDPQRYQLEQLLDVLQN